MEDQDIFNQIKAAANNDAMQHFGSMDKVWHRVEEKLDKKILKKENTVWKKIAVAASVLLMVTLGYQVFKNDKNQSKTNEITTKTDSIQKVFPENNAIVSLDNVNPAIKKEAGEILRKELVPANQVAMEEVKEKDADAIFKTDSIAIAPISEKYGYMAKDKASKNLSQAKIAATEKVTIDDVEVFITKENRVSSQKKEEPLLVFDNLLKNKQSVGQMDVDEVESLVELKEPLYIINGVEYTEQELFGPNPTSPYTPLTKQEIETISILQDEKAVSVYGEKGKKGVVIITTKNGKPVAKKKQVKSI